MCRFPQDPNSMGHGPTTVHTALSSMEGLELVCLHWRLILVQVRQRVLGAVVVGIIVGINSLRLEAGNCVKLLDGGCTKARQGTEDCAFNLGNLSILHCVNKRVLSLRGVVLQLLGRVLLSERSDLVEVHLQVIGHFLCELILRSRGGSNHEQSTKTEHGWTGHCELD